MRNMRWYSGCDDTPSSRCALLADSAYDKATTSATLSIQKSTRMNLASMGKRSVSTEEAATIMDKTSLHRRILVIDDDDGVRGALCDRLSALGFEVAAESNGVSGLARVAEECEAAPFIGMLVELQMPMLGGMAVLQEMCERFPTVRVIVMSNALHLAKLRQAIKLGAKEYLVKPFDTELVRRKCLNVFLDETHHGRSPDLRM